MDALIATVAFVTLSVVFVLMVVSAATRNLRRDPDRHRQLDSGGGDSGWLLWAAMGDGGGDAGHDCGGDGGCDGGDGGGGGD